MESLSIALQPYKELVGTIAAVVTTGQMFSGCFVCWDIYRDGTTGATPFMAFLGGLIMGALNLKYGFMLRDDKMIQVNFLGIALSILYVMVFYRYTPNKTSVWAQLGGAGALIAALFMYSEYEDPAVVEGRFGSIITAFMFYLVSAPLLGLKTIIKNKSTEGLPFPLILSGTVVTFSWLVYGIILNNTIIVLQNVVVFLLCAFQLSLFVMYPSKPKAKGKAKAKKTD
ncbi:sugar transporter SWEET1 [Aricia agestis]|uniref:sugar transporter SWEET1 n=1 Tax=Aricia agestis TaxID=91739 RepID=UPI001C2088D6|nr:sugar transporter SWEET1 [Aricia agestis]XP_041977342.1 sugar transporter SWEET1 [Aricia agestis]XP_041977343.1 sugar transporter SWEET1 [Aricia agestis]XP_041977344.1 sugar transporter SWEET1 [Aricia agestis]